MQASALEGLEPTLLRNLTDHAGNNLLHAVCGHGHAHLLPWLTTRFGTDVNEALNAENRNGSTPTLVAIKVPSVSKSRDAVRDRFYESLSGRGIGMVPWFF
jgi:hypothetical protein